MANEFRKVSKEELAETARQRESENSLDAVQDANTGGVANDPANEGVEMDVPVSTGDASKAEAPKSVSVNVDYGVVDQLDPEGIVDQEPAQVEDTTVVFMPRKDFEGRVNELTYHATKGVPVRIPRDVANIWLEDEERGYVKD